jgi:hypothetical protein
MKFMATWSVDQQNWLPILKKWSSMTPAERADGGAGVTIVGRWHDMAARTGVAILEATDAAALHAYINQWNPFMDLDVTPVLDDEESAKVAASVVAAHDG